MYKKLFYKFFIVFFILISVFTLSEKALADTSNIAKIAFITEPQTIKPNEVSKELTIQLQDSSGNKVSALETIRFDAFQSTSATGIFVSCTTPTNPPTDYLAKNSSNKNICYKDSKEGIYTITVKTSNTVNSLSASQNITVSSATSGGGDLGNTATTSTNSTATTTATTTSTTNTSNSGGYTYVYSSSVSLSTYEPLALNVEAGRERIAFLHSPVEFKAYAVDRANGKSVSGAKYTWTYGDGTGGEGEAVSHQYLFPGEYNVVLNSYSGNDEAVDVTKIKVVEAKVLTVFTDVYLEITNQSEIDLNIGGWKIKGNEKEYVVPRDTIISGKGSIKIPRQTLGKIGESAKLTLIYPDGQLISEIQAITDSDKQKIIAEVSAKISRLKLELAQAPEEGDTQQVEFNESSSHLISTKDVYRNENSNQNKSENSSAAPIEAEASRSLISKVLDFFGMIFK